MEYSVQHQSGSVITYVIVGVLLAAVSVGAIIVAQHRGSQQLAGQPPAGISQPAQDTPKENNTSSEKDEARTEAKDEKAQEAAAKKKAAEEAQQREAKEQREEKEREAAEATTSTTQEQQTPVVDVDGPMARTGGAQPADALPTTGPVEDTLSMVIGLLAISSAGYFYYHAVRRS